MSIKKRAEGFLTANETLTRRYEGLDGQTRQNLRIDLGFLPAPVDVATAGGLRLAELAHHIWDVKVAFDPAATLAPEATPLLFDQAAMLIGFLGKASELDGRPVTLAVRTAPAEWWLRLVTGRHAPKHTPATVQITGGAVTLDDLRRVFPGF